MKDEQDLVQRLLAHDEDVAVPADHERRIRAGLGALLDAPPLAPAEPPPAQPPPAVPAPAQPGTSVAGSALRKWATTALVAALAAGGGFAAGRATAPPGATPPPASSAPTQGTAPAPPPIAAAAESIATAAPAPASASPSAPPGPAAPPAPPAATGTDAFDREQSLLERARSALVRHDASAAEAALDEHDRQFPRSRHAEERDYLRIQMLRERGDDARMRERAKAFLAKYPESMLRARVEPLAQ
jgi:hypothetical protein